ncbi:MAG: hypothetical protein PHU86_03425 [Patescibacteria group bacterium]|nr:hypothetical protein [Patescibacteria group bacterium]
MILIMLLGILLFIIAVYGLVKGEIKLSNKIVIKGKEARWLSVYFLFFLFIAPAIQLFINTAVEDEFNSLIIGTAITLFLVFAVPFIYYFAKKKVKSNNSEPTKEELATEKIKKNKKPDSRNKTLFNKKWLLVNSLLFIVILIIGYSVLSYASPGSKYSYRSLFIDSKTRTYKSGQEFSYSGYKFTASMSFEELTPNSKDCSKLFYGGIFGPSYVSDGTFNQDYEPREECEKNNAKNTTEAKKYKNLIVHIKVKNDSKSIRPFSFSWFKVLTPNGKTYDGDSTGDRLEPSFGTGPMLPKSIREGNSKNIKVGASDDEFSLVIKIPGHGEQIIKLNQK